MTICGKITPIYQLFSKTMFLLKRETPLNEIDDYCS